MKFILTIAAMSAFAFTAFAAEPTKTDACCQKDGKCATSCCKAAAKDGKQCCDKACACACCKK